MRGTILDLPLKGKTTETCNAEGMREWGGSGIWSMICERGGWCLWGRLRLL